MDMVIKRLEKLHLPRRRDVKGYKSDPKQAGLDLLDKL